MGTWLLLSIMASNDKLISWEDYQGCLTAYFEWAESYDSKDWERLRKCVAPTVRIDYRSFLNKLWEAMPLDDFIKMISDPKVLGDPLLMTQHFCGASKWEKVSDTEIIGHHQLRVPHQKYTDASRTKIKVKVTPTHTTCTGTRRLMESGNSPVSTRISDGASMTLTKSSPRVVRNLVKRRPRRLHRKPRAFPLHERNAPAHFKSLDIWTYRTTVTMGSIG